MQRAFDAPFDVRSTAEAMKLLRDPPPAWVAPAVMRAVDWALGRGIGGRVARRFGLRVGGVAARKVDLTLTVAIEASASARDGIRELQVMASFLRSRLLHAGLADDHELIRRAVAGVYLQPGARPDLRRPAQHLLAGIARPWLTFSVPVPGQGWRRRLAAEQRLRAVAALDVVDLDRRWRTRPR